ncbi:uncharacterized protein LOC129581336 [Paramacrobiotus metropolitanus]|uniref:uncharacterized protein LOC129581336 n=1 Tax=Paramacrobiotus metropolitanus TaxID=2943436 RepID=UPI0024461E2D|nr:uncharacterized protein LOC129581336 [Paramacrobiotus metropolitanus]
MNRTIKRLLRNHISDASRSAYSVAVSAYSKYCLANNYKFHRSTLLRFIAHLFDRGIAYSTVRVYIAGISNWLKEHGHTDFTKTLIIEQAIKGFARLRPNQRDQRQPISLDVMRLIKARLNDSQLASYDKVLFWAACNAAFFGFLRPGEFTVSHTHSFRAGRTLLLSDLILGGNSVIVTIKRSKTDQMSCGSRLSLSSTKRSVCPYRAISKFYALRCGIGFSNVYPFFMYPNGTFLSRSRFAGTLKLLLHDIPYASHYTPHSFRIGAATVASELGCSPTRIKRAGRWKIQVYSRYIRSVRAVEGLRPYK